MYMVVMRLQHTLPHGNTVLLSYRTVQLKPHVFIDSCRYRPKPCQSTCILSLPYALSRACQIGFAPKSRQSLQGLLSARTCQNAIDYQFYVALHTCVPLHGSDTSIYQSYTIFSSQPLLYSCTAARAAFVIHSFTRTCQNVTLVISFMVLHHSSRSELGCFNILELRYI